MRLHYTRGDVPQPFMTRFGTRTGRERKLGDDAAVVVTQPVDDIAPEGAVARDRFTRPILPFSEPACQVSHSSSPVAPVRKSFQHLPGNHVPNGAGRDLLDAA